jgi:hypothetical protein
MLFSDVRCWRKAHQPHNNLTTAALRAGAGRVFSVAIMLTDGCIVSVFSLKHLRNYFVGRVVPFQVKKSATGYSKYLRE